VLGVDFLDARRRGGKHVVDRLARIGEHALDVAILRGVEHAADRAAGGQERAGAVIQWRRADQLLTGEMATGQVAALGGIHLGCNDAEGISRRRAARPVEHAAYTSQSGLGVAA